MSSVRLLIPESARPDLSERIVSRGTAGAMPGQAKGCGKENKDGKESDDDKRKKLRPEVTDAANRNLSEHVGF